MFVTCPALAQPDVWSLSLCAVQWDCGGKEQKGEGY